MAFQGMRELISNSKSLSIVSEFNPEAISQGKNNPKDFIKDLQNKDLKIYEIKEGGVKSELENIEKISLYTAKEKYTNILCQKNEN
jgi:hypothetical protein